MIEYKGLYFDWDETKNTSNKLKHGISFEESLSAFQDIDGLLFEDTDHQENEQRWILLGYTNQAKLLVVIHTEQIENHIRIISARKATKKESIYYYEEGI